MTNMNTTPTPDQTPERELTILRARLAEAEKERDEWKEQAESVPYNTLANINDTCRTRGFMEGPSGRATEDRVIALAQAYDTLRATNATMAERVRRLEEALTQIVNWGPFPDTGEFWPDGTKVSYGSQYGTNGEICYMVNVAKAALSPTPGAAVGKEGE